MTRTLLLLCAVLSSFGGFSQDYNWSFNIGGISGMAVKKILPTADDHLLVMGNYKINLSVDLDPSENNFNLNGAGGMDIFVAKYTKTGDFVWGFRIAGGNDDFGHGLHIDQQQNICITGEYVGEIDFYDTDTTHEHHFASGYNGSKGFVARYTSAGNFINAFYIEGLNGNTASGGLVRNITSDPLNNLYFTGELSGDDAAIYVPNDTISFNTTGRTDLFTAAVNPNGDLLWAFIVGGGSPYYYDSGFDIEYADAGLILGGRVAAYYDEVDFDPIGGTVMEIETQGAESAFLARYDLLGNCQWVRCLTGDAGSGKVTDFDLDALGNIYSTGNFQGATDFDPSSETDSLIPFGCDDIFVTRYTPAGDYVWGFHAGSDGCDNVGYGIDVVDTDLYLTGTHSTGNIPSDFDPSPADSSKTKSSTGYTDIFVARYNTDMEFYWAMSIGDNDYEPYAKDDGFAILGETDGTIYCGGSFIGDADFDVSEDTVTMGDVFHINAYVASYDAYTIVLPPVVDTSGNNNNVGLINLDSKNYLFYPNPAQTQVSVSINGLSNPIAEIHDYSGKKMNAATIVSTEILTVDLHKIESGVYFLELYDAETLIQRSKIVVR